MRKTWYSRVWRLQEPACARLSPTLLYPLVLQSSPHLPPRQSPFMKSVWVNAKESLGALWFHQFLYISLPSPPSETKGSFYRKGCEFLLVSLEERFRVGFKWVVGGGIPVENEGKGEGRGEGGGWGVGLAKEPASQCACVCQNYSLANYPLLSPRSPSGNSIQFSLDLSQLGQLWTLLIPLSPCQSAELTQDNKHTTECLGNRRWGKRTPSRSGTPTCAPQELTSLCQTACGRRANIRWWT